MSKAQTLRSILIELDALAKKVHERQYSVRNELRVLFYQECRRARLGKSLRLISDQSLRCTTTDSAISLREESLRILYQCTEPDLVLHAYTVLHECETRIEELQNAQ